MANLPAQIQAIQKKIDSGQAKNKWAALQKVKHLQQKLAAENKSKSWLTYLSK